MISILCNALFLTTFDSKNSCRFSIYLSGFSARLAQCINWHREINFSLHFKSQSLFDKQSENCEEVLNCTKYINFPYPFILKTLIKTSKMLEWRQCSYEVLFQCTTHNPLDTFTQRNHMLYRSRSRKQLCITDYITNFIPALESLVIMGLMSGSNC